MAEAIVLFSGGLDSILAVRILQTQDIGVTGLNIVTPFHDNSEEACRLGRDLGIEVLVETLGNDYAAMLKKPRWGFGKGVNPCIDCRTMMLRRAYDVMVRRGADFVATGEVVGQRPHSQMMHQLSLIASESGLTGKLLRPLSAKVLPITEPERSGLVCRDRLFSCTGRGRSGLIALARSRFGVEKIPQPSTGCLLCEQSFAPRVRDMLKFTERPTLWDAHVLPYGRHLRVNSSWKIVVARRLTDCQALVELFGRDDRTRSFLMIPENFNGPAVLAINDGPQEEPDEKIRAIAAGLMLRFVRADKLPAEEPTANLFDIPGHGTLVTLKRNQVADELPMIEARYKNQQHGGNTSSDTASSDTANNENPVSQQPFDGGE